MHIKVKKFVIGLLVCSPALMQAADSANPERWTYSQCLDYAYQKNISLQQLILANRQDKKSGHKTGIMRDCLGAYLKISQFSNAVQFY